MAEGFVTPKGKSSVVWKHFGYAKGEEGGKKAVCKLCGGKVERGGGTSNLKQHLCTWHRVEHDELYPEIPTIQTPSQKQCTKSAYLNLMMIIVLMNQNQRRKTKMPCKLCWVILLLLRE